MVAVQQILTINACLKNGNSYLYVMEEIIFLVEPADEGGYIAKALTHGIFTQGETLEVLRENIKDAVHCHFDDDVKRIIRLHLVHQEVFAA